MSSLQLALRSLSFHWRINFAVALGVMAATAVLTGALVVGDSVRGSLRHLIIDRLGRIDEVLVTPRFFREKLAKELAASPRLKESFETAVPAIMLQGTLEAATGEPRHRTSNVSVLGVGAEFWQLGHGGPANLPTGDEIVLNQPLADQLHAKVGDELILRLPQANLVPADSPLGRKTETSRSRRFTVSAVIAAEGLGRFGLRPTQQLPLDAFTAIEPLQRMIDVPEQVNAILVAGRDESAVPDAAAEQETAAIVPANIGGLRTIAQKNRSRLFQSHFRPHAHRTGGRGSRHEGVWRRRCAAGIHLPGQLHNGRQRARENSLFDNRGTRSFRTAAAGAAVNREGRPIAPLKANEIVLNAWAADDLAAQGAQVKPGDAIAITYFRPESTHGQVAEGSATFRLKDVAALSGLADDRHFTPEVKGITDEASIADWNPPFPYDSSRVRSVPPNDQDDKYWREHRATPKAFITLSQGRSMWGSRFGDTTSIRIPAREGMTEQSLADRLLKELKPTALGFEFLSVKKAGPGGGGRHNAVCAVVLGIQLFHHRRGADAGDVVVQIGHRSTGGGDWHRAWRRIAAQPGTTGAATRSRVRGDCRRRRGCGGRDWLCLADDRRAENVVAGGNLHSVSRSVRHAGKRCHWLCERNDGVARHDSLGGAAVAPR